MSDDPLANGEYEHALANRMLTLTNLLRESRPHVARTVAKFEELGIEHPDESDLLQRIDKVLS